MGPIGCPETSEKDYHSTLCNISEELRYHYIALFCKLCLPCWCLDTVCGTVDGAVMYCTCVTGGSAGKF